MNRAYSIVYNIALNQYQVVSEKTKTRRSKARKLVTLAVLGVLFTPALSVDITAGDGKNSGRQRLSVLVGQAVTMSTYEDNSLTWTNSHVNGDGGAIHNAGTLMLGKDVLFTNNVADNWGGAIYNSGQLELGQGSQFINNDARYGGAIDNDGTFILGSGAVFSGNTTDNRGGAIYNYSGRFSIDTGNHLDTTLFTGNLASNGSNSIYMRSGELIISGAGTLDMRDPLSSNTQIGSVIEKTGVGIWKLAGNNIGSTVKINAGTLYLYADNEVGNANQQDKTAKVSAGSIHADVITIGTSTNGAALIANGGNALSGKSLTFHDHSTLGFKISEANQLEKLGSAVLNLDVNEVITTSNANYVIDILTTSLGQGTYHLIESSANLGINTNQLTLKYLNYDLTEIARLKDTFTLNTDANNIYLVHGLTPNGIATWTSTAPTAEWNVADKNWHVVIADQGNQQTFVDGDRVIFNANGQLQTITIGATGVNVADMSVNDGQYKFIGGGIQTTRNSTGLTSKETLTINGGHVDFTGITGINQFAKGIALNSGELSIKTAQQLGADLSQLAFGANGVLNIHESITFDGENGASQRLSLLTGQTGRIDIAKGKTLTVNASKVEDGSRAYGGAIYNRGTLNINDSAVFQLNHSAADESNLSNQNEPYIYSGGGALANFGRMTLGNDVVFQGNQVSTHLISDNLIIYSYAQGGAIANDGTLILGSGTQFYGNSATVTSASAQQSQNTFAYGGAISNSGDFTLGANAVLQGNFVNGQSASGGAIDNEGTFKLDTGSKDDRTLFTGNLVNNVANSIHMENGHLNIYGDGTLDMRDPFDSHVGIGSTIEKNGSGIWKLAGHNIGDTSLKINEGTLYLYTDNEVGNANQHDVTAKVSAGSIHADAITIGTSTNGAALIAKGGNALSGKTLTLHDKTSLGFKISAANQLEKSGTAVLNLDFNEVITTNTANYVIDILAASSGQGTYHLIKSSANLGIDVNQLTLKYFDYDPTSIARLKDIFSLNTDANNIYLVHGLTKNGVATWTSTAPTAEWNVADKNWHVALDNQTVENTFMSGDRAVFNDLGLTKQTITINASGSAFDLNGMIVDTQTNLTFNGDALTLMNGQELVKKNSGTLAFNNAVNGDMTVNGGSLIVGDSVQYKNAQVMGNMIAKTGTSIGGHGSIAGRVTIAEGATLSPGNSIGTLTVGELRLESGSNVRLDVAVNGDSDKIVVKKLSSDTGTTNGNVSIGSNVKVSVMAEAGKWSQSTRYSFMTAEGTITGQFAGVTSNLAFLTPTLITDSNNIPTLVMERNGQQMNHYATTSNQNSVANAIDRLPQTNPVYNAVISLSGEQARLAYDNLSGELYASTNNVLFQNANRLQDNMLSRAHDNQHGLWINGWGYNGHINGDSNAAKVENQGNGLLLGYDLSLNHNFMVGAAIGHEESKIKIKEYNRKGDNTVKSTHFMLYGHADLNVLDLKAGVNYSQLRFKSTRYVNIPTLAGNVNAKYNGHQVHAFIEGSKTFNLLENYDATPYMNLAYTEIKAKSFTETGSQAALSSKGQSHHRTSIILGVKNDWYFNAERTIGLMADLGWKHTFGDRNIHQRLNFVGSDSSFAVQSASISRNSALIGVGLKGNYQNFTIDVGYQGEFNNKVKDHTFGATVKWEF